MPTITRTQVRQEMLKRAPILGRALSADSLAKSPPTLTDVSEYQRQRAGLTSYENQYINRYALADPDQWRLITTVDPATGIISVDGPAYTDATTLPYERLLMHPDDLNFAIAEGQRRQRVKTNRPLTNYIADLDMETAGVTNWTAAGTSVRVKDTTIAFSGTQSLHVTNVAGVNQVSSGLLRVLPGRNLFVACIVLQAVGNFSFQLYDTANAAILGSVVSSQVLGDWVICQIQASTPSNATFVQLIFSTGDTGAGDFYVDTCFGPYQSGKTEYPLPSAPQIDEAYKLRFVRPARYVTPLQTNGIFAADSVLYDGDLTRPEDWDIEAFRRDVNYNRLRFQANSYNNNNVGWGWGWGRGTGNTGTFMQNNLKPIWLALEAQVSDIEPLLTETATTNQPLDECACYSLRYLAETMTQRDPQNPVWQAMLAEYKLWSVIEDMGRPPQAMQTPQRYHAIRA